MLTNFKSRHNKTKCDFNKITKKSFSGKAPKKAENGKDPQK
jgi:hypothetical protein